MANLGIKIKWNIPQDQIDYSNLKATDFQSVTSTVTFPSNDPNYIQPFSYPYELLVCRTEQSGDGYDSSVYQQINAVRPSNQKDSYFVNINKYLTTIEYEFKPLSDLILAIRQKESDSNLKVRTEAQYDKAKMLEFGIQDKINALQPVTDKEQNVITILNECRQRAQSNSDNAARLIAIAQYNDGKPKEQQQFFDINSGWEEDNISQLDI